MMTMKDWLKQIIPPVGNRATFDDVNPATLEVIATLPKHTAKDAEAAVVAAERCFHTWSETTAQQRAELLNKWGDKLVEHKEKLAEIMVLEQGKPLAEARAEVDYSLSFIRWFAAEGVRAEGRVIPSPKPELRLMTRKMPLGVVAVITPWNFPAAMITRKMAPALAAGCTVVAKPAEDTPLTALALVHLAKEAGIPADALHILTGDAKEIGPVLTGHPHIRGLSFTGSTPTGKRLLVECAATVKKCGMELGGNAPFIICEDADIDKAVSGLLAARFRNAGQACNAPNRILVHEKHIKRAMEILKEKVPGVRAGNGMDAASNIGPLINKPARDKYLAMLDDAKAKGASIVASGGSPEGTGHFAPAVLLSHVSTEMRVWKEEIFAPILGLVPFATDEQAIDLANATEAGLAAYLYTPSIPRAWKFAEHLETGMLGINASLISQACAPFGGVKCSGLGREGSHEGLDEFMETQYLAWGV
ncbi:aldehyde dehydrogenase family protein [bacterium]|nr:aldehyde dehydrogenase family protein [bacterium]